MCNAEKEVTLLLSLFSKRNYNRHPIPHGRAMAFVSSVPDLSSVLLTKALYAIMAIQCYNEPCYSSTQLYVDFFPVIFPLEFQYEIYLETPMEILLEKSQNTVECC